MPTGRRRGVQSNIMSNLNRYVVLIAIATSMVFIETEVLGEGRGPERPEQVEVDAAPVWMQINRNNGAQRHWFDAPDAKSYTLFVESYQSPLNVWVATLDGDPIQIASRSENGQFRYTTTIQAEKGVRYQIGVGSGSNVSPPIRYRLALYGSNQIAPPIHN
jgi:hypothetical protein